MSVPFPTGPSSVARAVTFLSESLPTNGRHWKSHSLPSTNPNSTSHGRGAPAGSRAGSSAIVAASGRDHVLEPTELTELVGAGRILNDTLEPARDPTGASRPWDVEFGFVDGKLWLFQCRPFVGNDALKNVTALAALEGPVGKGTEMVSLEEKLK